MHKIILASNSKVRKEILEKNGIKCDVQPSNIDENPVKESLIRKLENSSDPKDGTSCKTLEFNIVMQNN